MGGGKSSGNQSTQAQLTPEQIQTINLQNQFLQSYLPTLTGVTQGANQVYQNQTGGVNNAASNAANTATNVANTQANVGAGALQSGTTGLQNASNAANGSGQAMVGKGGAGASGLANQQTGGVGLATGTAGQAGQLANTQAMQGQNNINMGSSALANMFSPQYEQQQVAGAIGPAQIAAQQANVRQAMGFAGAGEMGSARDALAAQQTQAMQGQELGNIAAQTEAGIQSQRQAAANSLLQGGIQGQNAAGSNYGNIMSTGTTLANQAGQNYGNILNAGTTQQGHAITGYGGLSGTGTANLQNAPGTAGTAINYQSAPLSNYAQYASLLFGAPQQTPNYAGTQGQNSSGSSKGAGIKIG